MDEKSEEAVKIDFPEPAVPMGGVTGRGVVWCGDGRRRFFWLQSKADRAQSRGNHAWRSYKLPFVA
jgi:hypothetical protein